MAARSETTAAGCTQPSTGLTGGYTYGDFGKIVEGKLKKFVAERALLVLGLDRSMRLDPRTPLRDLGLDSLMTLELRNRLEADYGLRLSATLVWNYPTIAALAASAITSSVWSLPRLATTAAVISANQRAVLVEAMMMAALTTNRSEKMRRKP